MAASSRRLPPDQPPLHELRLRRRVEFADTDLAGIIHFSRFFVFMETAEHLFLNAIGSSVDAVIDGVHVGWPRLMARCEFKRPVRFEDELEVVIRVKRKGNRSMHYHTTFRHRGELVAVGEIASACCEMTAAGPRAIAIPTTIAARIAEAAPESLDG